MGVLGKVRRHTNNKGMRQAKSGALARSLRRICKKLGLPLNKV